MNLCNSDFYRRVNLNDRNNMNDINKNVKIKEKKINFNKFYNFNI